LEAVEILGDMQKAGASENRQPLSRRKWKSR